jgi:N,N'-diacetyllegionaminate synthase
MTMTLAAEQIRIGGRAVGADCAPMVVAEIGVNHDGSVERALRLVDIAARVGADAVKLQVFRAEQLVAGRGVLAAYQQRTTNAESSVELLRRYELSKEELGRVLGHAKSRGLACVATPFSPADVPVCGELGLDALKIASPDVVNTPLLRQVAGLGRPMLVSTGAATMEEIDGARRLLAMAGVEHVLMHCVSSYPTPDSAAHLCFLHDLRRSYGSLVGYSDHADTVLAGALAVSAGAVVLERHLTYDKGASGPDHAASSDPAEFAEYVALVRQAAVLRGTGRKRVLEIERDVRRVSRQSLVLARDLAAGEAITAEHLTVKRPGTGIPARRWEDAIGRRSDQDLPAGTLLTWELLRAA